MDLSATSPKLMDIAAPEAVALRQEARLQEACKGFEALFMNEMLKSARNTSFEDSLVESSATQSTRAMLDTKLSEITSGQAGLGLGDAIYRQFAGKTQFTQG